MIIALRPTAEDNLSDHSVAEEDEDKNAEKFGKGIPHEAPYPTPGKVWLRRDGLSLRDFVVDERTVFCMGFLGSAMFVMTLQDVVVDVLICHLGVDGMQKAVCLLVRLG